MTPRIAWTWIAAFGLSMPAIAHAGSSASVHGRVVDGADRPVPGAGVQAVRLPSGPGFNASTTDAGEFDLELTTGSYAFVTIAAGRDLTRVGPIEIGGGGLRDLTLPAGAEAMPGSASSLVGEVMK